MCASFIVLTALELPTYKTIIHWVTRKRERHTLTQNIHFQTNFQNVELMNYEVAHLKKWSSLDLLDWLRNPRAANPPSWLSISKSYTFNIYHPCVCRFLIRLLHLNFRCSGIWTHFDDHFVNWTIMFAAVMTVYSVP